MSRIETLVIEVMSTEEIGRQRTELLAKWKNLDECSLILEESAWIFLEMDWVFKKIKELDIRLGKSDKAA